MESNRKINNTVSELFLRGKKLNILIIFISQSFLKVPKTIRLTATPIFHRENTERNRILADSIESFFSH